MIQKAAVIENDHDGMDHDALPGTKKSWEQNRAAKEQGRSIFKPENLWSLQDS